MIGSNTEELILDRKTSIKGPKSYKYLDVMDTEDGLKETEISERTGLVKRANRQLNNLAWCHRIKNNIKVRVYKTIIDRYIIGVYRAEVWIVNRKNQNRRNSRDGLVEAKLSQNNVKKN